jgi:predicted hydrocarbon binding protein
MIQEHDTKIANSQLRLTLLAVRQVIGEKSVREVIQTLDLDSDLTDLPADDLKYILPAGDYAKLLAAIETTYGSRGPRILSRIGRSTFHQILREQPNWMSSARRTMSLWKPTRRIELVLEAIIETQHTTYPNSEAWIENKNGQISYIEQNCLVCYGRVNSSAVCFLKTGFLSEAAHWATDREYHCTETACIATGDPFCRFSIGKSSAQLKTTANP